MTKESNAQEKTELAQIQEIVEQAQDQFHLTDMLDEAQILSNIGARVNQKIAKALVYNASGSDVLSKKGIDECVNKLSEMGYVFREELVSYAPCQLSEEHYIFIGKVFLGKRDEYGNVHELRTTTGIKRQWMYYKKKNDPAKYYDEFWFEKGSQKSIRNANRTLISQSLQQNLIEHSVQVKNGRLNPNSPNSYTPRPRPTSAIPQQPRTTRVLPQPPKPSYEEIEKNLRAETKWMNEPLPWAIDTDQGKRKFTWQELFDVNTITKDGEEYTCRRYLRTLAGACKENNAMLSAKATITADLIKKQEEDLEKSVVDPISITKAFILTMPNKGSWNGKWSQEGELFAVVKNVPSCKPKDGTYHYSWGDGWGANVEVKTVTKKEAKEIEKKSKGFCGYEWMIDSLIAHGEILSDKEKEEKLSSQDSLFPEKEEQHQYSGEGVGA